MHVIIIEHCDIMKIINKTKTHTKKGRAKYGVQVFFFFGEDFFLELDWPSFCVVCLGFFVGLLVVCASLAASHFLSGLLFLTVFPDTSLYSSNQLDAIANLRMCTHLLINSCSNSWVYSTLMSTDNIHQWNCTSLSSSMDFMIASFALYWLKSCGRHSWVCNSTERKKRKQVSLALKSPPLFAFDVHSLVYA